MYFIENTVSGNLVIIQRYKFFYLNNYLAYDFFIVRNLGFVCSGFVSLTGMTVGRLHCLL